MGHHETVKIDINFPFVLNWDANDFYELTLRNTMTSEVQKEKVPHGRFIREIYLTQCNHRSMQPQSMNSVSIIRAVKKSLEKSWWSIMLIPASMSIRTKSKFHRTFCSWNTWTKPMWKQRNSTKWQKSSSTCITNLLKGNKISLKTMKIPKLKWLALESLKFCVFSELEPISFGFLKII